MDDNGDIVIKDGNMQIVSDNELKAQTLKTVLGTNKGEWFLNTDEGINLHFLLGKGVTEDMQLSQVKEACKQVDENLYVSAFSATVDDANRKSTIYFTAKDDNGTELSGKKVYQ